MTRLGLEINGLWTSTPKTKTGKTRTMCSSQGSGRLCTTVAIAPATRFRSGNNRLVKRGANSRVTAEKKRAVTGNRAKALAADIELWEADHEEHVNALAEKHGLKVKEVRRHMLSSTTFKPRRKVSTYNAKISRIMTDLNEGRGMGERYTMPEVKRMVCEDPSMLEAFTEEEVEEMVRETLANHDAKSHGRGRIISQRQQTRDTTNITALAERAGMIGFAMFSRGHIHDKTIPVTIQSWGVLEFIREVLKRDPTDVAALFELWAVEQRARYIVLLGAHGAGTDTWNAGETGADTLAGIQKECTAIIKAGLQNILGRTKVAMNYESYIKLLVLGKNVGIVNWPQGVDFKRMSLQVRNRAAADPVRLLEVRDNEQGRGRRKKRKSRPKRTVSKRGTHNDGSEGEEGEDEDEDEGDVHVQGEAARGARGDTGCGVGRRGRTEADDGEGDLDGPEDEEDGLRKPITQLSVEEKRAWLLKLGRATRRRQERRKKDGEDGKRPGWREKEGKGGKDQGDSREGRVGWEGKEEACGRDDKARKAQERGAKATRGVAEEEEARIGQRQRHWEEAEEAAG
ncbi:hypothetical protein B0H14DRAFT_3476796 [Mycena olivaceomarginata]|nr:hypothetical protein B0H14DRAFT_3476796 [Mycena olivaceomarginata]